MDYIGLFVVVAHKSLAKIRKSERTAKQFARFFTTLFKERRTEADGKFVYFKTEQLACDIMTKLVYRYHNEQNGNGEQYTAERFDCR